jgi:anthranilate synthase component 1
MTLEEFSQLAKTYNVIPVSKTLLADTLTPVSAYLHLREGTTGSFLFESVEGGERIARYSFIGINPSLVMRCSGSETTIIDAGKNTTSKDNFFDLIDSVVRKFNHPSLPQLPRFTGGLVGFIGYDAIRFIEQIPCTVRNEAALEDSILGLFSTVIAFDHLKHQITIIVNAVIDTQTDFREAYDASLAAIALIEDRLAMPLNKRQGFTRTNKGGITGQDITPEIPKDNFTAIVQKGKEHIHEGDIFQVVLSQRFSTGYDGDTFSVYRALRIVNPSPYLYYMDFEGYKVIGSSPEILVRVENNIVEVYPIAGTRPRGATESEDQSLERELLSDEKERAEHIMLVDLGRNDLGRVCEIGSVKVDQLMTVVRYSHVMHIASRVTGKVASGKTSIDVLKATFPAGTVSGAPKIRAMEIIDTLEKTRRGIYAGGVGYFDFSGNMDMCIAIRTMFAKNGTLYFQTGAGIVADSVPENEYQETLNKGRALVEALKLAQEIR